jgi:hypothetical protein
LTNALVNGQHWVDTQVFAPEFLQFDVFVLGSVSLPPTVVGLVGERQVGVLHLL